MSLKQQEKKEVTIFVEALVLITLKIRTMAKKWEQKEACHEISEVLFCVYLVYFENFQIYIEYCNKHPYPFIFIKY